MDEFNDMLSKNELSEDQLNVCRDIRRRGKNKVWTLGMYFSILTSIISENHCSFLNKYLYK